MYKIKRWDKQIMNEIKKIIEFKRTEIGEFLKVFFSKNIEN